MEDSIRAALGDSRGIWNRSRKFRFSRKIITVGSPIVLGIDEHFVASDATPIVEHTRNVIYLDDNEFAVIGKNTHHISKVNSKVIISKTV